MDSILDLFRENWRSILLVVNYLLVTAAGITILLDNRNPSKTYAYLLLLIFVPIAGLVVFYFFGRDFRKKKVVNHKAFLDNKQVKAWSKELERVFERKEDEIEAALGDRMKIARMLMANEEIRALPSLRNKVTVLTNGECKFPVVLEELAKAKNHIHLEYYIFADEGICEDIARVLMEKARAGVKVRFIYDAMGATMGRRFIRELKEAGVEMFAFLPVKFHKLADKVNYRDHRKIIVIDGKVGFTGGINIDDRYNNDVENEIYWRDTHLMIEGEAVRNLQLYFLLHWHFVSEQRLPIDASIFPKDIEVKSQTPVQIIGSGPDNYFPAIEHVFLMAINSAQHSIYVTTPYFIPTEQVATALQTAALGGVEVHLILPEKADHQIVQSATCSYIEPLLRAGVHIHLYKKGFMHAKVMIVDDTFATVGTCNLDTRSFLINWEINAVIYDKKVNDRLREDFEKDLKVCRKLSLRSWEQRGNVRKVFESVCRVISPII
jgi:cardiolipin synthase